MNVDKKLSSEWGSKVRKVETRKARRRQDRQEARQD